MTEHPRPWPMILAAMLACTASRAIAIPSDDLLARTQACLDIAGAPEGDRAPLPSTAGEIASLNLAIERRIAEGWTKGALSVAHGLAASETTDAIEVLSRDILDMCVRSMRATDALVSTLDAMGNATDDGVIAQLVAERRTAVPLRAARAAFWSAACRDASDPGIGALLGQAASIAAAVDTNAPAGRLERALLFAQVALAAGELDAAGRAMREAMDASGDPGLESSKGASVELFTVSARVAAATGDARTAKERLETLRSIGVRDDGTRDFASVSLAAQVLARMTLDASTDARSSAVRFRASQEAAQTIGSLIDVPDTSTGDVRLRRAAAYAAARGLAARLSDPETWPGLSVAAIAEHGGHSDDIDAPAMIDWLTRWLGQPAAAQDPFVDDVRLQLARVLAATEDAGDAARAAFLASRFVRERAADDRAGAALALACAAALAAERGAAVEPGDVLALLRTADEATFEVPLRDRWRLALIARMRDSSADALADTSVAMLKSRTEIASRMSTPEAAREASTLLNGEARAMLRGRAIEKNSPASAAAGLVVEFAAAVGDADDAALTDAEIAMALGEFARAEAIVSAVAPPTRESAEVLFRAIALQGDLERARAMLADAGEDVLVWARWIDKSAWVRIAPYADLLPEDVPTAQSLAPLARALMLSAEVDARNAGVAERAGVALGLAGMHAEAGQMLEAVRTLTNATAAADLALVDARMGVGDDAGAFAVAREIASAREAARNYDRQYFRAWLRMLQILDHRNADGSRTDSITREAFRLTRAPELESFDDLRRHLEAIAKKYPPPPG